MGFYNGRMFLKGNRRTKDGKTQHYWNVVENRRLSDGRVVRRQVPLFPVGSMPGDAADVLGVRLEELELRLPRQCGNN